MCATEPLARGGAAREHPVAVNCNTTVIINNYTSGHHIEVIGVIRIRIVTEFSGENPFPKMTFQMPRPVRISELHSSGRCITLKSNP